MNLHGGRGGVAEAVQLSAIVDANKAKARLPFADVAVPWTQKAMHAPARHGFPPARLVQRFSFLEDFEVLHGAYFAARCQRRRSSTQRKNWPERFRSRHRRRKNSPGPKE